MQHNDQNQQDLTSLRIRSTQNRVQIAQEEEDSPPEPNTHQSPVQRRQRAPADKGDGNPNQVRVSIERPRLNQVRAGAAKPLQRTPQRNGDDARVSVNQARGAG